ncbi:MAG: glycosyltransferase [Candidatus Falkowbacteria bacterium]
MAIDIFGYEKDKIDIIMFNMATFYDWDRGVVNRNYNVMNELAKNPRVNRIIGVDFLPIKLRQATGHYFKNLLLEIKTAEMIYGDLTSACYRKTDKIYAYTTIDSIFSFKIVARELRRIEKILNLRNIVFWSYNPMFVEFIGRLNERLIVFDTVDNWIEHSIYPKLLSRKRLCANYKIISEKADLIFTVSEELLDFYKEMGRKKDMTWIPNGVDFAHFNDSEKLAKENELSKIDKKIIGYLGTIENRLNFDLLTKIADNNKDKVLVLVGPVWPSVKSKVAALAKRKNVKIIGRVKYNDAPSYISRFDAAIIPHQSTGLVKSMNPMKLYDYLACGKPIITTSVPGAEMFKEQIYISKNDSEFLQNIARAMTEDSLEKTAARRAAVKPHSWSSRVSQMTDLVFKKL